MKHLKQLFLSLITLVIYLAALPFALFITKVEDEAHKKPHLPPKEIEKRQTRRLLIFSFVFLLAVLFSVFFRQEIQFFFSTPGGLKEAEEASEKFSTLVDTKVARQLALAQEQEKEKSKEKAAKAIKELYGSGATGGQDKPAESGEERKAGGGPEDNSGPPPAATAPGGKQASEGPGDNSGPPPAVTAPGGKKASGGPGDKSGKPTASGDQGKKATPPPPSDALPGQDKAPTASGERPKAQGEGVPGRMAKYDPNGLPKKSAPFQPKLTPPPTPIPEEPPVLRDVRVTKNEAGERVVVAEVVNKMSHPLSNVEVVVKFTNYEKEVIHERRVNATVVAGGLFGDRVDPIKPGDIRQFSVGVEDIPSGWNGNVEAAIKTYE